METTQDRFMCSICGRTFGDQSMLDQHQEQERQNSPQQGDERRAP
jgi:hypothetical protein